MTSELTPFAGTSVVVSGRYALVAGLQWQWVPVRGGRRMRVEARDQVASRWVAVPTGTADEPASMLGLLMADGADIPRNQRQASLAVALSANLPADCWGVFLLPSGQWWFMASVGGCPSPFGDVTGDAAAVTLAVERFSSAVPAPATGWVIFDPDTLLDKPGSRRETLQSLLPVSVPAAALLHKTEDRTTSRIAIGLMLVIAAGWGANHWLEGKRRAQHEADVRAALIKAREAAAAMPDSLARPWGGQPDFAGTLTACIKQWRQAPLSIAGWVFRQAVCESTGQLTLHYALPDGGTVGDFAARLPMLYGPGVQAAFNMPGPSDDASFKQDVKLTPAAAETLLPGDERLRRMTSYAQRLRANLRFSPPQALTQKVGQDTVALPWKRYSFTFITDIPPDRLFDASRFPGNGLRLSSIKAELHSSRLTYTLEGMLYAEN